MTYDNLEPEWEKELREQAILERLNDDELAAIWSVCRFDVKDPEWCDDCSLAERVIRGYRNAVLATKKTKH